jgi:hypothetical protein
LGATVDSFEKEKTSGGSCEQLSSPLCNFFWGKQTPRAKMGLRVDAAESRMKKKVEEEGRLLLQLAFGRFLLKYRLFPLLHSFNLDF